MLCKGWQIFDEMYCELRQWICVELEMRGICLMGEYGRSAWGLDKSLFDPPFKSYVKAAMELTLQMKKQSLRNRK